MEATRAWLWAPLDEAWRWAEDGPAALAGCGLGTLTGQDKDTPRAGREGGFKGVARGRARRRRRIKDRRIEDLANWREEGDGWV